MTDHIMDPGPSSAATSTGSIRLRWKKAATYNLPTTVTVANIIHKSGSQFEAAVQEAFEAAIQAVYQTSDRNEIPMELGIDQTITDEELVGEDQDNVTWAELQALSVKYDPLQLKLVEVPAETVSEMERVGSLLQALHLSRKRQ